MTKTEIVSPTKIQASYWVLSSVLRGSFGQGRDVSGDLPIPYFGGPLAEFDWKTDQAIEPKFLEEAKNVVAQLPNNRRDLATSKYPIQSEEHQVWLNKLDKRVGLYTAPWFKKKSPERQSLPSPDPFNLLIPDGLRDIDRWLHEQGIRYEYHGASMRAYDRERGKSEFNLKKRASEQYEDNFIRLIKAWNEYHVKFLELLNVQDGGERAGSAEAIGKEIFGQPLGFRSTISLEKIAPFDNPALWMVYNSLNVLISPEPRITSVARYRAVELLTHFDTQELELSFFGEKKKLTTNKGRERPSWGWNHTFGESLLSLPRKFWVSAKDRTENIHKDWEDNPKIRKLFGKPLHQGRYDGHIFDYGVIFNRLVEQHPNEAAQIALLMMNSFSHNKAAFEGLLSMTKLDPITIQKVFGPRASYQRMHQMPSDSEERILEQLGIEVFDEDFAVGFEGLTGKQMKKVMRRYQVRIWDLERQLAEITQKQTNAFFASRSKREIKRLDQKGYWRLLGVHPETDPGDLLELLKRSYRVLATKYHPDGTEPDEEKMKQLNEAYSILSDTEKRKRYCDL